MESGINRYLDDIGRVKPGLTCDSCGYDLRGQPAEGGCSECGEPIRPMLELLGELDGKRPLSPGIAIVFACACPILPAFFYLLSLVPWSGQRAKLDWYDIFNSAALLAIISAAISAVIAAIQERKGKASQAYWFVTSSLALTLLTIFYFGIAMIITLSPL